MNFKESWKVEYYIGGLEGGKERDNVIIKI